jgi:hypothetical protein
MSSPPPMFDILALRLSGGDISLDAGWEREVRWCARFTRGGVGEPQGVMVISHTENPQFWEGCQWNLCFNNTDPGAFDVTLEMPPDVPRAKGLSPQVSVSLPWEMSPVILQAVTLRLPLACEISRATRSATFTIM